MCIKSLPVLRLFYLEHVVIVSHISVTHQRQTDGLFSPQKGDKINIAGRKKLFSALTAIQLLLFWIKQLPVYDTPSTTSHQHQSNITDKIPLGKVKYFFKSKFSFYHFINSRVPEVDKTLWHPAKETKEKEQDVYKRKQVKYQSYMYVTLLPP